MGGATSRTPWTTVFGRWMAEPPGLDGLRDGAVVLAVVRSVVLAFLFPFAAWFDSPYQGWVFLVVGLASIAHAVFVWWFLRRNHTVSFAVAQTTILVDTIAIGVGVALTGGATSAAASVWGPNLAIGAVWIGVRAMVPAIALVGVTLGVLAIAGPFGDTPGFSAAQSAVLTGVMLTALVLVGGIVAQRQHRTMRALDAAESRARRDPLTGLLNRTAVEEQITQELARAARYGLTASLLMFDLDDFKQINDTHGHLVGDLGLTSVADILRSEKRAPDVAGRLGGEEFVVLLPETPVGEAVVIAERVRERINRARAADQALSTSIGVASYPDHARTAVELVMSADSAVYAAKADGKNCVRVFDPETHARTQSSHVGSAASLARCATEIAVARGAAPEVVQAVRMAALTEVFEGRSVADPQVAGIVAEARAQLAADAAP